MKKNVTEKCICDKCKTKAVSIPGKQHRRCSGTKNKIRKRTEKLSGSERGTWQIIE